MSELALKRIAENKAKHARGEDARVLDLGYCGINQLPDLSDMDWLETLIVSDEWWDLEQQRWIKSQNVGLKNRITISPNQSLPSSLRKVVFGGKWGNRWSVSSGDFLKKLTNLQILNLSSNQISNGDFLTGLSKLQSLDLSRNQISNGDFLKGLSNLQALDLGANQISNGDFLKDLPNLRLLHLGANQISNGDFLKDLKNLQSLDLSNNQISNGDFLKGLSNLQSLDLTYNQISNADFLENLTGLTTINLSKNKIEDLTPLLYFIREKEMEVVSKDWYNTGKGEINIKDNPLTNPPLEIVAQGNAAIIKWLTAQNKRPILEAKVMFIGDSGYGKTHLIEMLRHGALARTITTTLGIERNQIASANSPLGSIRLNVWDLGGQEFMRSTHQFFFTTRTLYVLVTDARQGERREDMRHWLNLVRTLGENAPVLIAINKIDSNDHDIDRESIQKEYPNVLGFVRTCVYDTPSKGIVAKDTIVELKRHIDAIVSAQKEMPSVFYEQREEWFTVKEGLEQASDPYITIEAFRKLEFISALPTEEQDLCLQQLNFVGSVVSYFDDARLSDTHVIDPKWIMDGVYAILTDTTVKDTNKGKFDLGDMRRILSPKVYPDGKLIFLTDLMQKFRLCYPQRGVSNTFLLPDLFTDAEPPGVWQVENPLCYRFDYDDYPPDVFMAQFIAEKYKSIEGEKRWRSGVVICDGQCRAIVRRSFRRDAIDIEVVGPKKQQRGFLRMIREVFYELHEPFNTLKPKEVIPYKDQWLDYWDLLKAEADGDRDYRILGGERIQLSELLDGYAVEADRDFFRQIIREEFAPLRKSQEALMEMNTIQLELLLKNDAKKELLFQTLEKGFHELLKKLPPEHPISKEGNAYLAATDLKVKLKIGHELLGGQLEGELGVDVKKIYTQLKKDVRRIIQDFRDGNIFTYPK
ncbi:MAG: leucine-rich repeat domain-containing protein [Chitinophagales bacterium]|nr:leucine-rich repeat domain-containing protein [Chitinophagales bacterium]